MNIIANNNANSLISQLIPGLQGGKTADGTVLTDNFLNIISMLSENSELNLTTKDSFNLTTNDSFNLTTNDSFNLTTNDSTDLLLDLPNIDNNFSTLQLLQKFLDEHGVNTKEKIQPELASKFFELLKLADIPKENITAAPVDEVNPQGLPIGKVLISAALENIKKISLQDDSSQMPSDIAKTMSTEISVTPKFLSEPANKLPHEEYSNKVILAQSVIDTTVFESSKPKTVVIDIGHIVDQVSEEFNKFEISKVFTSPAEKLGKESEYQDAEKPETISSLSISLTPKLVAARAESETSPAIYREVLIPDESRDQDKAIVLEIDKVEGDTVIATIMSDQLNQPASLPKKIILKFSETKPAGSEPSVNLSVISEENFTDTVGSGDTKHAILLTKGNEKRTHSHSDTNLAIKIFDTAFIQVGNDRADLSSSEIETFSKDFSDELAARLKPFITGEFNNKNMLTSLQESLIVEDNNQILADSIKVQLADLLKSIEFRPKSKLMLSTADVLGYREAIKISEKQVFDFQFISNFDDVNGWNELKPTELELKISKETGLTNQLEDNFSKFNLLEAAKLSNPPTNTDTRVLTNTTNNTGINSIINSLNLYEAQFTSRLGMLLADQISQGNENFELQLEPETFGKVRINVSLENSNVEVKMIAENSAAVLALRGGEIMLQNIAEQHGLKLSDYSVDMQSNQNGQGSGQKGDFQKNDSMQKNSFEEVEQDLSSDGPDGKYKLNLLA